MIRPYLSPFMTRWCITLFSLLWLSGCAISTQREAGNSANPDQATDYNVALGIAYLEQGNLPRAQAKLDKALAMAPNQPEALQAQALLYQRQGKIGLANDYFIRALSSDSQFTRARNNYAAFLYAQGQVDDACKQLQLATQDSQYLHRAQLYTNLGRCHRHLGDLEDARQNLLRAQAIDPRHARSYLVLAEIDYMQGEIDQAWEQLQSFIRLAGNTSASLHLAQQIASTRGDDAGAAFYSRQLKDSAGAP